MQALFQGSPLQNLFDEKLRLLKKDVQKHSLEGIQLNTLRQNTLKYNSIILLQLQLEKTKNFQVKGQRKIQMQNFTYDGMRYEIPFLGNSVLFNYLTPIVRNEIIPGIINGNTLSVDAIINGDISKTEVQEKISSDAKEIIDILQWYIDQANKESLSFNNKLEDELNKMIDDELTARAEKQSVLNKTNPFKSSGE